MKLTDLMEMAKRVSPDQFYNFGRQMYGTERVKALSWPEIKAIADKHDILIPAYLRSQKVGRGRFNIVPVDHADTKEEPKKFVPFSKPVDPREQARANDPGAKRDELIVLLKKHVPMKDLKDLGRDDLYWRVTQGWRDKDSIEVSWEYTFRRNTKLGAYHDNKHRIQRANEVIKSLAEKFKEYNPKDMHIVDEKTAKMSDERNEANGDSAYSEYEQNLSGGITFAV